VSLRLLYVAIPDPRGVIRVSVPLSRVDGLVTRSRQWVLAGGLLTLALVGLLSRHLGRFWHRPISRLQETLAAIGRGEKGRRVGFEGGGALAAIGGSVDEMAAQVEDRLEAVSRERADLRSMFDELEDGVAQVDRTGAIVRSNRAFRKWIGRAEVGGERIGVLLRDPDNVRTIEEGLAGRRASNESLLGRRTVQLTAHPDPQGALVVLRDLTRTRQLESVRRDFVANVSHELKTPLTNIRGFAEAIAEDDQVAAGTRVFADRIVVNAKRMQALVDDLLDLSRIESGAWVPEPADIDLADVADEVWGTFDTRPANSDVTLAVDCPDGFTVCMDPDALRQILRNLLDNALRYAPSGSQVTLSARRAGEHARIEVSDGGPGIPTDHLGRVFERFYRVDAARSREAGGTGLGLSIVKHLAAAHGGETGIESEVGTGTRVWFTVPGTSTES
jgi:signal transduction histidine kinase